MGSSGRPARSRSDQRRDLRDLRVLYIASVENLLSKRYRVDNMLARLRLRGTTAASIYSIDVARRLDYALSFDVIVLQALATAPDLCELIDQARERGTSVAFDADDYVFEPTAIAHIAALHEAAPRNIEERRLYMAGCREALLRCDAFIGSTAFLAERAAELGLPTYVIPNGVNERQMALARRALSRSARGQSQEEDEVVRIGYQPGTRTHQADFAVAEAALLRLMREEPQVTLVVQGPLAIPPGLAALGSRIQTRPFVSWQKLVVSTAALDIAIAPLELDNPVNEAKSTLKYFEAGLVAVPVVASPTQEFRSAVQHGMNGFLAGSPDEWYACLRSLVRDRARRRHMGRAAREDVLARYTPWAQSLEVSSAIEAIVRAGRT